MPCLLTAPVGLFAISVCWVVGCVAFLFLSHKVGYRPGSSRFRLDEGFFSADELETTDSWW